MRAELVLGYNLSVGEISGTLMLGKHEECQVSKGGIRVLLGRQRGGSDSQQAVSYVSKRPFLFWQM